MFPVQCSWLTLFHPADWDCLESGYSQASGSQLQENRCDRPGQELRGFRLTAIIQKALEGIKGSSWATLVPFRALPQ